MNVLDLFSGIGGFSLGLERAGMRTVAFCEPEPFCRAVLAKHWPHVPCYDDVRTLTADRLAGDGIGRIDVIAGGFPCQDISTAGKGAGLAGKRSGLWFEFHRLIAKIKPRYAIIENVSALRSRGLDQVLGSLVTIGYDAEWHCIPASAVGAPHRRDRIWIVAYPDSKSAVGSINSGIVERGGEIASARPMEPWNSSSGRIRLWAQNVAYTGCQSSQVSASREYATIEIPQRHPWWKTEPDVGRVAHGVPARLDRLKALGNAVVPQIPEIIGRAIMENEK